MNQTAKRLRSSLKGWAVDILSAWPATGIFRLVAARIVSKLPGFARW